MKYENWLFVYYVWNIKNWIMNSLEISMKITFKFMKIIWEGKHMREKELTVHHPEKKELSVHI